MPHTSLHAYAALMQAPNMGLEVNHHPGYMSSDAGAMELEKKDMHAKWALMSSLLSLTGVEPADKVVLSRGQHREGGGGEHGIGRTTLAGAHSQVLKLVDTLRLNCSEEEVHNSLTPEQASVWRGGEGSNAMSSRHPHCLYPEDTAVLAEVDAERGRKKAFEPVFPCATCSSYLRLFPFQRRLNLLSVWWVNVTHSSHFRASDEKAPTKVIARTCL